MAGAAAQSRLNPRHGLSNLYFGRIEGLGTSPETGTARRVAEPHREITGPAIKGRHTVRQPSAYFRLNLAREESRPPVELQLEAQMVQRRGTGKSCRFLLVHRFIGDTKTGYLVQKVSPQGIFPVPCMTGIAA